MRQSVKGFLTIVLSFSAFSAVLFSDQLIPEVKADTTTGLVAHWKLDETVDDTCSNGYDLCDSSGNDHHMVIGNTGRVVAEEGMIGYSQDFRNEGLSITSSIGGLAYAQASSDFNIGNSMTVSAWVRPTQYQGGSYPYSTVIGKGEGTNQGGSFSLTYLSYSSATSMMFRVNQTSTTRAQVISTSQSVPLLEWTHVVATTDGTTLKIYINGVLNNTASAGGSIPNLNTYVRLAHNAHSDFRYYWRGNLDDVRLYGRALSQSDINQLYAMGGDIHETCPASVQARFQVDGLGLQQSGTFSESKLDDGGEFQWSAVRNEDVNQTFRGQVTLTEPDSSTTVLGMANGVSIPTPYQTGTYTIHARATNGELCDMASIVVVPDPVNGTVAPPSGIGVETEDDGTDVTITPNLGTEWVYVRDVVGDIVGKIQVDLNVGRDWRAMQVGRRAPEEAGDTGASVLHYPGGASNIPGIVGSWYYLYVPRDAGDIAVRVCPGAESVSELGSTCSGGLTLTEGTTGQYTVTKVNLEGDDLWQIAGVTGTGGVGVNLSTARSFTLTPSAASVSSTTEVTVYFTSTQNFGIGDTIAIDFDTGGTFVLDNCASPTVDADGDTTTDGAGVATTNGGASNDRFLYTFTAPTTTANTSGVNICVEVSTPATVGNYQVDLYDSHGGFGSAVFYVGNENQVNITADVDTVFTFDIRNSGDTGDLPNVDGLATGPNLCDLGSLSDAGVQTCSYRLKVTTNANSGYTVNIATDGSLRNSDDSEFIDNVTEDTTVASGTEGYGIAFVGGSCTEGILAELGDFDDDDTPTATAVTTGIDTSLYRCYDANNPSSTDTTNTALVTHRAEADSGTPAGTYTQLVTYTVSGSF